MVQGHYRDGMVMILAIICIIMNVVVAWMNYLAFKYTQNIVDFVSALAWMCSALFWIERIVLWQ